MCAVSHQVASSALTSSEGVTSPKSLPLTPGCLPTLSIVQVAAGNGTDSRRHREPWRLWREVTGCGESYGGRTQNCSFRYSNSQVMTLARSMQRPPGAANIN